ncbi:MAG: LysR family transcriptional regulator [Acidovorax sp.]
MQMLQVAEPEPLGAEDVYRRMSERGTRTSLGTVYRTMKDLEAHGLLLREWSRHRRRFTASSPRRSMRTACGWSPWSGWHTHRGCRWPARPWRFRVHLHYFRAVPEEQNFHRAAERIPVDLSALSRPVGELEDHVGVELLVRSLASTRITPAGAQMRYSVRGIFDAIEQATRAAREVDGRERPPLRIGIADGLIQPMFTQCPGPVARGDAGDRAGAG